VILVDTSVWVDHLRAGDDKLVTHLELNRVVSHPFIVGELACGNIKNRTEVLGLLSDLAIIDIADHQEVLDFIEFHQLMGRGIGYVDVHLLAAVYMSPPTRIWTRDERLLVVAVALDVALEDS
jgi:predicted nucleic acid-binding protein